MPSPTPSGALTVGFDLDMTLIDSRPGIHAAYLALSAETGTYIDADLAVTRLGPPLEDELVHWFPDERIAEIGDRYREMYPAHRHHRRPRRCPAPARPSRPCGSSAAGRSSSPPSTSRTPSCTSSTSASSPTR